MPRRGRWSPVLSLAVVLLPAAARAEAPSGEEFFEKEVRPLLVEHCLKCHGENKPKGGLRLTSRAEVLKGGDGGPAAVAGKPDASLLVQAVRYRDTPQMPPRKKLSDRQIAVLERWVQIGLPWPQAAAAAAGAAGEFRITDEQRRFWAFQPVRDVKPPAVRDAAWARTDLDRFLLAGLEARGLRPAPPADRRTLLRRAAFDLTGLPPTPEEAEAFVRDDRPDAFARAVDRLLASPAYGERWGRHWLDLARYTDSFDARGVGGEMDCADAWRYRDWVVRAFNADLPYDQFVTAQLAGDLLPAPGGGSNADGIIATGFLALGNWGGGDADKDKLLTDIADDQVDVVGRTFLGLTLACARCHDHKFDPISTADYYGLAGIFFSTHILPNVGPKTNGPPMLRIPLVPPAEVEALKKAKAPIPYANGAQEGGVPGSPHAGVHDVRIHVRGRYDRLGPRVPRRFPEILAGREQKPITGGSGRLELARWLTRPDHPLTARVLVNRVWQNHFGEGIVRTPSNFGKLGRPPTHPELLDWLARDFVAHGWSLKRLHRTILLSAAYQQGSDADPQTFKSDPDNLLFGRMNRRRLEAEALRDALLAASGRLDRTTGGPAVRDFAAPRRTLYLMTVRSDRSGFGPLFDAADPTAPVDRRTVSTVAPQALFLLNNSFVLAQTEALARRLAATGADDGARIDRAYRLLYGRPPTAEETSVGAEFLKRAGGGERAWQEYAEVLVCANEFIYVD